MMKRPVTIRMEEGMDARPIALLVQEANQYSSQIYIELGEKKVNAKSIMGMMSLCLQNGENIVVSAEGEDESDAIVGVQRFLMNQK